MVPSVQPLTPTPAVAGFDAGGRFYRGNLHCHSTISDGHTPPAEVVAAYKQAGYDFIALSDHFEPEYGWPVADTRALRDDAFTTMVGAELSSASWEDRHVFWVSAVGLPPDFPPPGPGETKLAAIRRAHEAGAFVVMLHPGLNNLPLEVALGVDCIDAVEIYNHSMASLWPDAADGRYVLDGLLEHGHRVFVNAGDDAHSNHPWDKFGGWVMVRADALDPDLLLAALKRGAYYSTQGPDFRDLSIAEGKLTVRCSPSRVVAVTGGRRWLDTTSRFGEGVTETIFDLQPFRSSWCRVTLVDDKDRRAWSNPIWLDDDARPLQV